MAYDEELADRARQVLDGLPWLVEKRMFGGIGFLVQGNMACGVLEDYLIVRVGTENYEAALSQPHVRQFDLTGRPMRGWVVVENEGIAEQQELQHWVRQGLDLALSLPPK